MDVARFTMDALPTSLEMAGGNRRRWWLSVVDEDGWGRLVPFEDYEPDTMELMGLEDGLWEVSVYPECKGAPVTDLVSASLDARDRLSGEGVPPPYRIRTSPEWGRRLPGKYRSNSPYVTLASRILNIADVAEIVWSDLTGKTWRVS